MQTESLAKAVLDNDQLGALRRYVRESPIDETRPSWTTSARSGIGGHYLGRKSTRRYSRTEVWRPQVFQRGSFEEYQAPGRTLLEEAVARARDLLAGHEVAPLAEDAAREIDAVVAAHDEGAPVTATRSGGAV